MSTHISAAEFAILTGKPKRSKYHAKRCVVSTDGVIYEAAVAKQHGITGERFDSKAEASRWLWLRLHEKEGLIHGLERQPVYVLHGLDGSVVCQYAADFRYQQVAWTSEAPGGRADYEVVEDVKGVRTAAYVLKKKLVEAEYGVTIREIKR